MIRLAAVALLVAGPLAAQEVHDVLATAEAAYRRHQTLRAEFTQTIINPMLGGPEETRGVLYLAPPDRFSMRFEEPEGDRVVADGVWLWLYTPSSVPDQVIRQPIPEAGPASPNLFAQFVDRPLDRYTATDEGADDVHGQPVRKIKLLPRVEGIPFRQAVISVSEDGLLRRIALVEESGQRRTLVFDRIALDPEIPDAELSFSPPRGTKVVVP